MSKKVALFGLGRMGRNHARELKDLGALGCCVDINPATKEIADGLEVPFVCFTGEGRQPKVITRCEVWDIVTPVSSHLPLLLLGCQLGKEIFVEKPPLESTEDIKYVLQRFPRIKIGVDYIEMSHPVLQVIYQEMRDFNLKPTYFLHHREKNRVLEGRGEGGRVVLYDLVHDLSEIDLIRDAVLGKPFSSDFPEVRMAYLQSYKEAGFSHSADARAEFVLKFGDGTIAEVKGSFIDPDHRQFMIVTGSDKAFYGNTLEREFIKPAAALIEGSRNIARILEMTKNCAVKDEESQRLALKEVKAQSLFSEAERREIGRAPLRAMLKNFLEADSKKELICSLDRAYFYQKITEEVYRMSGHP